MWLNRLLLQLVGYGAQSYFFCLHTLVDTIVAKGWHTIVAPVVEFACVFLLKSFYWDKTTD
jgi:hypothetical protein